MITTRRQPGDRRWFPAEFPLTDSEGVLVPVDRRRLPNRRGVNTLTGVSVETSASCSSTGQDQQKKTRHDSH